MRKAIVIGSGAAGLAAALRLYELGVRDVAVFTEGLDMGTSINTGSDKQTYYKLGMYGAEADSPYEMACGIAAGGSMQGDIALVEAALSPLAFSRLVSLGVPFPHDQFGQYIGYKTDHDPKRRATSCGPYTSRDMCRALIRAVRGAGIPVLEHHNAVRLLTDESRTRCTGAVFLDTSKKDTDFLPVTAENVVFATGGPGGLYGNSVYPAVQTGGIGLALAAGATAVNLAESQFGIASKGFRWNLSGSYMQVLPRFLSLDADGVEREFLREYFPTAADLCAAVFRKGYQWPFSVGNIPGSSMIDLYVHRETIERGRRVFLDYTRDPEGYDFAALDPEARTYLQNSGAAAPSPFQRLLRMNPAAADLFLEHGIDLSRDRLEIGVCAQHCNGGLAGNIWWESLNLKHLFPVGEVNGEHGVTRPGGSALNAGQVGALRAAEYIARSEPAPPILSGDPAVDLRTRLKKPFPGRPAEAIRRIRERMDAAGSFLRSREKILRAEGEAAGQWRQLSEAGLGGLDSAAAAEVLSAESLCLAQLAYLASMRAQCERIGSRGGSAVVDPDGSFRPEDLDFRRRMMFCRRENDAFKIWFEECRPVPRTAGWFETEWRSFREGACFRDAPLTDSSAKGTAL